MVEGKTLIIIGAIAIVGFLLYSGGFIDDIIGGKKITCEVSVKNPRLQRAEIVSGPSCFTSGGSLATVNTLVLTDDNDIKLTLSAGGESRSITDRIGEGKTKTYTIALPIDENIHTGTLRLSDLKGDVETRTINF